MSNHSNRHSRRAVRFTPRFEALEDRSVPAAGFPGISAGAVAIAPEDGGIPRIKIVNPATGEDVAEIQAYEDAFRGGVNVALGDVTGDGVRDLIIAPGAGGGPRIRIVDGKTGDTLNDFFVYESTFTGGINVAVGDVDGDGIGDIITGTGNGGGPRVRVLDGATLGNGVLKDYFAYEDSFRGGVIVASGDLDGDGRDDVVTGTGVGGGPRVIAFAATDDRVLRNFFAYEDSFRGGVLVATGDLDGDGRDDIVTGTGPGGGPVVRAFAGAGGGVLAGLFADDSAFRGGVRVGTDDLDGDGRDEIVARVRHGNDVTLRAFDSGDGSFLRSFGRTVDDNPSPDDLLERPGGGTLVPGIISGIEGGVVAVNPTAGTVDIRLANGTVVAVQAGPGTKIERDDLHTTLAAFQIGDRGEALIGTDGTAWEIEAQSVPGGGTGGGGGTPTTTVGKVEGAIAAVNASAGTVTIQRAGGAVVVQSGPATKIERNDLSVNLAAFAVGDRGEALIGTDGIASKIEAYATTAGGGGTGGTPTGQAPGANAEIEGSVTAIDLATNRVSIRTQNGTAFLIQVVAGTKVERNDVETSLASFRVGDAGQAKIDANGLTFKLEAVG